MAGIDLVTVLIVIGAAVSGAAATWFACSFRNRANLEQAQQQWQRRFNEVAGQTQQLVARVHEQKSSLTAQNATHQQHSAAATRDQTEIESLHVRINEVSKSLFTVSAERDELKDKAGQFSNYQRVFNSAKHRIVELQTELRNSQEFHKSQMEVAGGERKALESGVDAARSEIQSLNKLLASAKSEYESASNVLASTQARLKDQDGLNKKIAKLEAEKVDLEHKESLTRQANESLRRDLDELNALKAQHSQLVRCLESMDNSRKQYESDARRYRSQFEKSEHESDTLRFKMGDMEKRFAQMRVQDEAAGKPSNGVEEALSMLGPRKPEGEIDNLQEIVGVGKVYEKALHDLGIYQFRQIAAFGLPEIARVNSTLKDLNGRLEHDDWIGQARDLHFRKHGQQQ